MNKSTARRTELLLLGAILFALPTFEAIKNILIPIYFVFVIRRVIRERPRIPAYGPLLAAISILLVDIVSSIVNWPMDTGLKGIVDGIKYVGVFVAIYYARYSEPEARRLAIFAVVGALVGLLVGLVENALGYTVRLEFHSVGPVTQATLYLGIAFVLSFALALRASREKGSLAGRAGLVFTTVTFGAGIVLMASRGGIAGALMAVAVYIAFLRSARLAVAVVVIASVTLGLLIATPDYARKNQGVERLLLNVLKREPAESDVIRYDDWRVSLRVAAEGNNWILGIGPRNYVEINPRAYTFDPPLHPEAARAVSHGHNLFITRLTETGVFGLASFVWFFLSIAIALWRDRAAAGTDWRWGAALGAIVVSIAVGSFNPPFYQEHAFIAMALFALFLTRGASHQA